MIEVRELTKRFGRITAVDNLSFQVHPGRVTGFLGPNGAGKTTTLRIGLSLVAPTAGSVTFDGVPYSQLRSPMRQIGATLDTTAFHPGRTALQHLRFLAPEVGVSDARCAEVLELVGLTDQASRRVRGYSMGMRARLSLAAAMLGDPGTLLLDEPTNGLDPEGINWMRRLLRTMAEQGRTILVSSHLLAEVEQTVDDVVIIARGRLVRAGTLAELRALTTNQTLVAAEDTLRLAGVLQAQRWQFSQVQGGAFVVTGPSAAEISRACAQVGLPLVQLTSQTAGLEQLFFSLTEGAGL
jgi:ABC-2 type transport system ATP-binding protein